MITVKSLAHSESLTGSYQWRTFRAFYQLSLPPSPPLSFSSPSPFLPTLPIHHDSVSLAQRTRIPESEFIKTKWLEHSREFSWSWGMFSIPAREQKKSTNAKRMGLGYPPTTPAPLNVSRGPAAGVVRMYARVCWLGVPHGFLPKQTCLHSPVDCHLHRLLRQNPH